MKKIKQSSKNKLKASGYVGMSIAIVGTILSPIYIAIFAGILWALIVYAAISLFQKYEKAKHQ